jgi:hypothetical protein
MIMMVIMMVMTHTTLAAGHSKGPWCVGLRVAQTHLMGVNITLVLR